MVEGGQGASFATVTHARLRLAQGDVDGATRILEAILRTRPGDEEARGLLRSVGSLDGKGTRQRAGAADRARRAERLVRWIDLVRENRRAGDVR